LVIPVGPGSLLSNDSDVDEDEIAAVLVSGPSHGVLELAADGSFVYAPDDNYYGPDSFVYHASDGTADSGDATVTIWLDSVDDSPVGVVDNYDATEEVTLVVAAPGVLDNDENVDDLPVTSALLTNASHGNVVMAEDGSFMYTPVADYYGPDSFTYTTNVNLTKFSAKRAAGLKGEVVGTVVNLMVANTNDPPVSTPDTNSTVANAPLISPVPGPLANDTDPDGDPLTAVLVSGPAHGVLLLAADGSYRYTPNPGYVGPDSFSYAASDGTTQGNTVTVVLDITASPTPLTTPPAAAAPGGQLPTTGSDIRTLLTTALAMITLGSVLLTFRRRRLPA
jgi:LPXTG-motif cell wall-anchored protein